MKISLITCTYNSGKTIADTIKSVLAQTYLNIEYIIIDGLSEDSTIDIIESYQSYFGNRLKIIKEKDKGIYDAMNKGIKIATGDIVGILNSDDFFTSNDVLKKVVDEFEKSSIDAVYGDIHYVHPEKLNKVTRYYSSSIFKKSLMRIGLMPAHPSFYVRRNCFEKYGLYKTDYKICADFDLLLRFIYVNDIRLIYLPIDMVAMRTGGASTNGIESHFQIMKEHLRSFKENNIRSNIFFLSIRYIYKLKELLIKK